MAIEDETAVAATETEVVKPEAAKDDAATAEGDKAPDPEADKEEPEKDEKPKSKRADRYRDLQDRAKSAEAQLLFEARKADRLQREIDELRGAADGDDFDKAQSAKMKLAVKETQYDELRDNHKAAYEDRMTAKLSMFDDRVGEAVERIPDLKQVLNSPDFESRATITKHGMEYIFESERGPDIAYHLYQNPSEGRRIAALPPALQGRELARIEHALISKPNVKKHSSAPSPVTTIGGSKAPAAKDPANMSMDEFAAWYKTWPRA